MKQAGKLAVVLLVLGLSACANQATDVRSSMIRASALQDQSPNDIAVLPIEDRTADKRVGRLLDYMRQQVCAALPRRKYVPLSIQTVDASFAKAMPVDGSSIIEESVLKKIAGKADEDAVLAIQINRWDESSLRSQAIVRFAAEITLLASKGDRTPLWSGGLEGQLKAGGLHPPPRDPTDRAKAAIDEFVVQLVDRLPRRRSTP